MKRYAVYSLVLTCLAQPVLAQEAVPLGDIVRMPVREITVFKDGHSFVLHEGEMASNASGDILLDHLPRPVMGTFWPYSVDKKRPLKSVTAGRRRVRVEKTALTLHELLRANVGADVAVTQTSGEKYAATIEGFLVRTAQEIEATSKPDSPMVLPREGKVILLKTSEGTRVVALDAIRDVVFRDKVTKTVSHEEFRDLMTLRLDWGAGGAQKSAKVGMVYLQKGIRWIPSYRVTIDGRGTAKVELKATLLNELTDLENVTAHLVIGVPSFAFKDSIDPIAVQKVVAQLSRHFQDGSRTRYAMSNAIMTQTMRMGEYRGVNRAAPSSATDMPSGRNEDLFLFTLQGITLKKGERMVIPVATFQLPYEDIFKLSVPMLPPAEVRRHLNNQQRKDLARLFHLPKVMHTIRLENNSNVPLTTAPALIIGRDGLIGQGMMTYTSIGSTIDLELTAAIDVPVTKHESETGRTPDAMTWHGNRYSRVRLKGSLQLRNHKDAPVKLEVTRHVLGQVSKIDNKGLAEQVNMLERDDPATWPGYGYSGYWYSGSYWWNQVNSISRVTWNLTLEAGKDVTLGYEWEYYWR